MSEATKVTKKSKVDSAPVYTTAQQVLSSSQLPRFENLVKKFKEIYQVNPLFVARSPGRVNLIGEHVDYSGYAVLPMAIEQDFLLAVAITDDNQLTVANVNPKFPQRSMKNWPVEIDSSKHDWLNYFLAGYRGILEHAGVTTPKGMKVLVDGNVPPGSGLSSSSAFVVCAALATLHTNGKTYAKDELATVCAKAEHYVGTEGGGMDQSIACLAETGTAKLIEFNPIRATDVPLPKGGAFIISNSCVEANKYVTAGSCYNKRVVECRAAAMILAKALKLPNATSFRRLGELQQTSGRSLTEMIGVVTQHLHEEDYTQEEMAKILGIDIPTLHSTVLSPFTVNQTHFALRKRAQHVFQEAALVWRFKDGKDLLELGQLMNASHASCRDLYECSCPELDILTQLCRDNGAYGSRLTGAGWGGCAVSLVPEDKVEHFMQILQEKFYTTPELKIRAQTELFATKPGAGIAIIDFKEV